MEERKGQRSKECELDRVPIGLYVLGLPMFEIAAFRRNTLQVRLISLVLICFSVYFSETKQIFLNLTSRKDVLFGFGLNQAIFSLEGKTSLLNSFMVHLSGRMALI